LRLFSILIGLTFVLSPPAFGETGNEPAVYLPLMNRLVQDGFEPETLSRLFSDSRAEPIPAAMTLSLDTGEPQDIYEPFLTPSAVLSARTFLQANLKLLKEMEHQFHVDREVVVAILLIESRFGENIGRRRVLPTLASQALTDSPENLWTNYLALWKLDPDLSFEGIEERARRKAAWAYQELKCFLRIVRDERIDPLEVRGSYAGALGMAQFMPSSYLAYAHKSRGLEDWLQSKEDAVRSIANYLRSHGWKKSLTPKEKKRILWHYNRSEPYVETVLEIAARIRS
jgi:membrane-bound lytic murein transglycosylase B